MLYSETLEGYPIEIPQSFHGYNVIQRLDCGTTSVVYMVEDQKTKKKFAAKIMSKKNSESKSMMNTIMNEIKVLQSVSHPNIIKVEEVFEIKNEKEEYNVIVMEHCSKGDLLSYANNVGFQNESEKKKILLGFLSAVEYLHKKGISHGDIKLENILLDDNLTPKLCDFGFCRLTLIAGDDSKKGTLFYAAPELLVKGQFNTLKSDIWAIGIALYSITELQFPFKEINQYFIIQQILNGKLSINEDLNSKLRQLVERCTAKNPSNRPTIDDILHDEYFIDRETNLPKENLKQNKEVIKTTK
ncbi:hypothetical protein M9Y10_020035 [Tritrichomonas musculus]|uniref:Protein kinase domain-containing protein n=1 Tax=Tritrichomonas musculus TaxID=1915356 RepID=A0ABR2HF22_9EUKA